MIHPSWRRFGPQLCGTTTHMVQRISTIIDHITPKGVTFLKEPLYIRWPYNAALGRAIDELSRDYPRHIARFRKQQEEAN